MKTQRASATFSAEVESPAQAPGVRVVLVRGRISYREAHEFRRTIFCELDGGRATAIVVDLAEVDHMDTAGVAVLVESLLASRERRLYMLLCRPSISVLRIFQFSGLRDALENCCATIEEMQRKLRTLMG